MRPARRPASTLAQPGSPHACCPGRGSSVWEVIQRSLPTRCTGQTQGTESQDEDLALALAR